MPKRKPTLACERYTRSGVSACKTVPRPRRGSLGFIAWSAPSQSATLFVGRNRGNRPGNRTGVCAGAPKVSPLERAEDIVLELRTRQVGRDDAGLTRMEARGVYEGVKEPAVAIQVFASEHDKSWKGFRKNIGKIAETLAQGTCQDEIIVVYDDSDKRESVSYAWTDRKGELFQPAGDKHIVTRLEREYRRAKPKKRSR